MRVGIIGGGAIASAMLGLLKGAADIEAVTVLLRGGLASPRARRILPLARAVCADAAIADRLDVLIGRSDVVVEAASHQVVAAHGAAILDAGRRLIVASVGALADDSLRQTLEAAARAHGTQLVVPSGAVGAIDIAAALAGGGMPLTVRYTGRKPPAAWAGTAAAQRYALQDLKDALVIFAGSAREAALTFPQNANVAATVALATSGLDRVRVRLIADPQAKGNSHEIDISSAAVSLRFEVTSAPAPGKAGTSASTAYSLVRALRNLAAPLVI